MGRKQHQKDKSYISRSEWEEDFGGFKRKVSSESEKALPFDHCSLTLSPFTNPVCSPEGHVFDLEAIIPYLEKNENKNPINGAYLNSKDLIRLHFSKSEHSGRLQCPITLKEFNSHSHIVAIKQTGNVFLYETLKKFAKDSRGEYADPLDQKRAFNWPTDLIEIQNPKDLTNRYLENFEFLKKKDKESSDFSRKRATSSIESDSQTQLQVSDSARLEMYEKMKSPKFPSKNKKGLVTLETNLGHIDLILDCDLVPQTCHNFLTLCERGYYNDINFHRLIPGFMVQGGDPKGDGTGGKGAFNDTFPDEFHSSLQHDSRGIISMANRGKNTNSSQL